MLPTFQPTSCDHLFSNTKHNLTDIFSKAKEVQSKIIKDIYVCNKCKFCEMFIILHFALFDSSILG